MSDKVNIFEITIEDNDDSGVDYIALVDDPAIMKSVMAFNAEQEKERFKAVDEDERIILGAAMIPDLRIFRSSKEIGDYYCFFSKDTIKKIVYKYHRKGFERNVNLMHDKERQLDKIYYVGGFITNSKMGIKDPEGFDNPEGTWYVAMRVDDDAIWQEYKEKGTINGVPIGGYSVEGLFGQIHTGQESEKSIEDNIVDIIKSRFSK